jgi:hypothetical protein
MDPAMAGQTRGQPPSTPVFRLAGLSGWGSACGILAGMSAWLQQWRRVCQTFRQRGWLRCRSWILGGFACFFALIAPSICWGGVAEATHGHAAAHFVFYLPPVAHTHLLDLPHQHDCPQPGPIAGQDETADGVARPATLLTALLLLLLVDGLRLVSPWPTSRRRLMILSRPLDWFCPILTPPPRRLIPDSRCKIRSISSQNPLSAHLLPPPTNWLARA